MPVQVRERLHPLYWRSKCNGIRRFTIVDIAGNQDVNDATLPRQFTNSFDCPETSLS
jgi:hypothetical protein